METPTRLLVKEQWEDYARNVVPAGASREQIWETRRAFYAGGAAVMFGVMVRLTPGGEPTPADTQILVDVHDELLAFNDTVKAGVA